MSIGGKNAERSRTLPDERLIAAALGLCFSAVYVLLRSNQYTEVDGALRAMQVYWRRPPYLGGNNHLLYPFNVWVWYGLGSRVLGGPSRDPLSFLRRIQVMNAIAAGGAVAMVSHLVRRFGGSRLGAIAAAAGYGLSWAMLRHATTSAEPMVGLFISLASALMIVDGLTRDRPGMIFAGGAGLALATANYESMLLIAPALLVLCGVWPGGAPNSEDTFRAGPAIRRVTVCGLGILIAAAAIYPIAYYSAGVTSLRALLRSASQIGGAPEAYGGFTLSKLINLPAGLVLNLVGVANAGYAGFRWLIGTGDLRLILEFGGIGVLVAAVVGQMMALAFRDCRERRLLLPSLSVAAALCIDLAAQVYWEPTYDKLWLQPLAVLFVAGGVLACRAEGSARRWFAVCASGLIAVEAVVNLPLAIANHRLPTRCLADAQAVAAVIGPHDKVVAEFDAVSSLWMALYDQDPSRALLLPASDAASSLRLLEKWGKECAGSACRIDFIGVLDQPRAAWEPFLGKRLKLPFDAFDLYRRRAKRRARFACEDAEVRSYQP